MSNIIRIKVRFFSLLKYETGISHKEYEMVQGETAEDLLNRIFSEHPKIKGLPVRVAVNQQYVSDKIELKTGDEVALIPPVSGG